jgi:hypothetical protein
MMESMTQIHSAPPRPQAHACQAAPAGASHPALRP